ncbi:AcrB/AcrD/AcrF family protein [Galactobacter valiniphilus]|uniref:AcrB/AcrD/AcrF family protein n=1 Tax=Galactobacter valiniphilus TaxID=2676122 RepID=A0A399JBV0_9MICC|nr:efflux RND transporter permease subunit [Galactobacter valiniphilus]RII42714.1 AcrB/AcrD/AcrF family protein [Galactobacter valiniphilus]
MHLLARLSLRNRALIVLVCLFVCVFGVISMTRLKQELIPSVEFPRLTVMATQQGSSPAVMDEQVGRPLESAMQGVEGLESSSSTSTTGMSVVSLTFTYGTDLDRARNQVDRAISNVSQLLPDGVQPNTFAGSVADIPVVYYAVSGEGSLAETADKLNADVVPALSKLDGVRGVDVSGAGSQYIRITPHEASDEEPFASPAELQAAIANAGRAASLGSLTDGSYTLPIQTNGAPASVAELRQLPVATQDGGTYQLGELAKVEVADNPTTSITRTNGKETLALSVTKTPDADTVRVSEAVRDALPALAEQSGATFTLVFDQAPSITNAIHDLTVEGLMGLVMAIVVILLFLRSMRSTLVTAISIPLSLLVTFIGVWAFGFSLNMLTLGALTISIGRVVDDSIVVIENIKRHLSYGQPRGRAIIDAVREVAGAITASTLTTVAVFLPVAFVGGLAGELFRPFALTVAVALIASLLVALTIVPVLAYWFLAGASKARAKREAKKAAKAAQAAAVPDGAASSQPAPAQAGEGTRPDAAASGTEALAPVPVAAASAAATERAAREAAEDEESRSWLQRGYVPVLRKTQAHPVITLVASVLILLATVPLGMLMKTNLLGGMGQEAFSGTLTMPAGSSLRTTDTAAKRYEEALRSVDGVKDVQVTMGPSDSNFVMMMGPSSADTASFTATTAEGRDVEQVLAAAREEVAKLDLAGELELSATQGGGFSSDITIDVKAADPDTLETANSAVMEAMRNIPGAVSVESNLTSKQPQVLVTVDRQKAAEAGLSQEQIAALVNGTLNPLSAGKLTFGFTTLDVKIGEGTQLNGLEQLENLEIMTQGGPVPLSEIATVKRVEAEVSITSQNTDRVSTVTITPIETELGKVAAEVTKRLDALSLKDGATATLGGAATQQAESFQQLGLALIAAIAIVYVIMVATFKSLMQPLILLVSIPFAAIGSIAALLITGVPLGLASLIGMLMLVGIVVTNAIVLIDLINQYRKPAPGRAAMSLDEAIEHGARRRLRPILMTALATIFAMIPMALGLTGSGGFISRPLAVVVIGGLVSSTLLTLILVPVLYRLLESRRERKRLAGEGPEPDGLDDASLGLGGGPAGGEPAPAGPGSASAEALAALQEAWTGTIDLATGLPRPSRGRHAAEPPTSTGGVVLPH